jgi:signal transduction histidine kinase
MVCVTPDDPSWAQQKPADGLATTIIVAVVAIAVATITLDLQNRGVDVPSNSGLEPGWTALLPGLAMVIPGALLLRRMPRHRVAWVLVVFGFIWAFDGLAAAWATYALYTEPGAPLAGLAHWFYSRFGATLLLGLPLLLLLFPDGRLPEHRGWRRASVVSLVLTAVLPVLLIVAPTEVLVRFHGETPPPEILALSLDPFALELTYDVWQVLLTIGYAAAAASLVVPFGVVVHRYRASTGDRRLQMRWLVWAALVDLFAVIVPLTLPDPFAGLSLSIAVAITSAAIVVAVTRYRLYDIDRLLSATVVYGLLFLLVIGVDLAVFAVAGSLLGERDTALVAIAVVAVAYTPLRSRLWAAVRRLVRGGRDDPYGAVSTLAERLELAAGPEDQLMATARSLSDAFRLPYVRLELDRASGEALQVEHGSPSGPEVTLPVGYQGVDVGRLVLCSVGRASLSDRDQRLLGDLVRQAVVAARASELNAALQHHREQLVLAREEERRRIRRDLHDSLGPTLAAVSLRIETARNLAGSDPVASDRMLRDATSQVRDVLAEVRRLAHDLRPPALDELGLLRAINQQAEQLSGDILTITVVGDDQLSLLPAAVEVAAFRIASEALANVQRHSRATRCDVTLRLVPSRAAVTALQIVVRDNGIGLGDAARAGIGTLSVRERAAELGGEATIEAAVEGGTVVTAVLPFSSTEVTVDV